MGLANSRADNGPGIQWHDIYRVNLVTGKMTLMLQHDRFSEVTVDDDYRLRSASQITADGGMERCIPAAGDWKLWDALPAEDMLTTERAGFDKANRNIFLKDSRGRDTSALMEIDSETRASIVLAGLTFTPDLFACGVDLVGVANLITWKDAR